MSEYELPVFEPGDKVISINGPTRGVVLSKETSEIYIVRWSDGVVSQASVYNLRKDNIPS